VREGGRKKK
jgi:hypothetical protein